MEATKISTAAAEESASPKGHRVSQDISNDKASALVNSICHIVDTIITPSNTRQSSFCLNGVPF